MAINANMWRDLNKKRAVSVAILLICASAVLAYSQARMRSIRSHNNPPPGTGKESAPITEEWTPVVGPDGWVMFKSKLCGITYRIPSNWVSEGWKGEGSVVVVSPEAIQASEDFIKNHPDQVAVGEIGPDVPRASLAINCQPDLQTLIASQPWSVMSASFKGARTLEELFASRVFHAAGTRFPLIREIEISGDQGFEIADTSPFTIYNIFVKKGKFLDISLGRTEYAKLPVEVKGIIASIQAADK